MKKLLLLTSAFVVLTVGIASAQGTPGDVHLRWNNCFGVGTNAVNKNYACDGSLNGAPFKGVFSFVAPVSMNQFVGIQGVMDFTTGANPLPDWWKLGVGDCRDGNFSYPLAFTGIGNTTCVNPWVGGNTGGGFAYYFQNKGDDPVSPTPWPGYGRIKVAFARDSEKALVGGVHYVAGVWSLDTFNDVDTGAGVCAGCEQPACLVMNSVELYQTAGAPPQDIFYLNGGVGGHATDFITWQGGAVGGQGCPLSTPAKNKTWGSVKALYR